MPPPPPSRAYASWSRRRIASSPGDNIPDDYLWFIENKYPSMVPATADETPWPAALPPPWTKMCGAQAVFHLSREDVNAQRSGAGWATARDRFPGRVDRASAGRGDGTAGHRDTVVNRRATSPDPRPQARVFAVSRMAALATGDEIFLAATGPDPRRKQACARPPETARGSRTRTSIFIAAPPSRRTRSPGPRTPIRTGTIARTPSPSIDSSSTR